MRWTRNSIICLLTAALITWQQFALWRQQGRHLIVATSFAASNDNLIIPPISNKATLFDESASIAVSKVVVEEEQSRIRTREIANFALKNWSDRAIGSLEGNGRDGINARDHSVIEFGLGGSTYLADYLKVQRPRIISDGAGPVDNDQQSLPFHPKKFNVSLQESFRDNSTVVYLFHQRKAGGSSLRKFLFDEYAAVVGTARANATSYVPCLVQSCVNWDPDPRQQFIGQKRLLAGHLSITIAAARAVYGEKHVLLSNSREPMARIESCVKFRFPRYAAKQFADTNFKVQRVADFFLTKRDADGDTCLGEPFRMLSPFNPDEVVSDEGIQQVCNFAKTHVHMVDFGLHATFPTMIERELELAGTMYNLNKAKLKKTDDIFVANMKAFKDHIRDHPVVQSELKLYDCVSQDKRLAVSQ